MTVTETRPEAESVAAPLTAPPEPSGLAGFITSVDHKRIGRAYLVVSLLLLVLAAVIGELIAVERGSTSGLDIFDNTTFEQSYTLHATAAVFLFLLPIWVGLGTVLVPLQVGARGIAFPRAAAAAFWAWLIGSGLLLASYLMDGGPFGGDARGVELWLVALAALTIALLVGLVCVATTALTMRAPGMTLGRTPAFTWSLIVGAVMALLSFPVLVADLVLLYLDNRYAEAVFGGSEAIWSNVSWFFSQPQVYVLVIPALGIAAEVVVTLGRTRVQSHGLVQGAIAALAILGFGAYAQPTFSSDVTDEPLFVGMGILAVLPVLLLVALIADAIRRGNVRLGTPLLFGAGTVLFLLLGAAAGAAGVIDPFDLKGTTWEAGQAHFVLLGAGGMAVFAALHYWAPKVWGGLLSDGLGKLEFVILFGGVLLLGGADLVSGALDQPLLVGEFAGDDAIEPLNIVAAIGGGMVVLGAAIALLNVLRGAATAGRADVPANPWGGVTLEWATASPPSRWNFDTAVPEVASERPLADVEANAEEGDG